MRALPALLPDTDRRFVTRVPAQPYLRFDRNYSLDPRLVGRRVEVRAAQAEIAQQLERALVRAVGEGEPTREDARVAGGELARVEADRRVPASSGQTVRYRLNRGGDRQLNRALHTIVLSG